MRASRNRPLLSPLRMRRRGWPFASWGAAARKRWWIRKIAAAQAKGEGHGRNSNFVRSGTRVIAASAFIHSDAWNSA